MISTSGAIEHRVGVAGAGGGVGLAVFFFETFLRRKTKEDVKEGVRRGEEESYNYWPLGVVDFLLNHPFFLN